MKHLIASSVIGTALLAATLFMLARPDPPLSFEQYLAAAYCPERYVNTWDYLLSRVQAAEPPPELRSFHDNMLEGIPRASRAWEARPEPVDGIIDIRTWPEFEEYARALTLLQPENAGLDPEVEEALNVFCAPRIEELKSRMLEEAQ